MIEKKHGVVPLLPCGLGHLPARLLQTCNPFPAFALRLGSSLQIITQTLPWSPSESEHGGEGLDVFLLPRSREVITWVGIHPPALTLMYRRGPGQARN